MANSMTLQSKTISHAFRSGGNQIDILVVYKSRGGSFNQVVACFPLFNKSDINLDGSVSWAEWFMSWTPFTYGTDKLARESAAAEILQRAAVLMRDPELRLTALKRLLSGTFKVARAALVDLLAENILGPVIGAALQVTATKKGWENSEMIMAIIEETLVTAISAGTKKAIFR